IRLLDDLGIAGAVFHKATGEIVHDAYADERSHPDVDQQTGYTTASLVCAPIRSAKGTTIGVVEMLNKLEGAFDADDLTLLAGVTSQCADERSEEHTSELQSQSNLVCRLLLEKKKK